MAQKVKFLTTSAGEYGLANTGDELIVKNSVAAQLEKNGTIEIVGEAGEDEEISKPSSGSVRFADETAKTEGPAGETDEDNPTGADKKAAKAAPLKARKEKNSKAGPNGTKKK